MFFSLPSPALTLLDAKAAGPLLQGDVLVIVQVTGLEEASGAVLHGDQGSTQRGQLRVGQVPAKGITLSQEGRCWPQLSGLATVPVPSQYQPLNVTRVKDWYLPLQPAVLVTKEPPAGGPCQLPPPHCMCDRSHTHLQPTAKPAAAISAAEVIPGPLE